MILNARDSENRSSFERLNFGSMKTLLDQGVVTNEEFKNYVWHSYVFNEGEVKGILKEFEGQAEVVRCEYGKIVTPYYQDFLDSGDLGKFKEEIGRMLMVMMKHPVNMCLERTQDEKDEVLRLAVQEALKLLDEDKEIFQDYLFVVIRKLAIDRD